MEDQKLSRLGFQNQNSRSRLSQKDVSLRLEEKQTKQMMEYL